MSRTVLIVGVTGIAGFNTAQAFTAAGWRVLGLSRSHRYDIPGVEQLRGDVLDPESLDRALAGQEFSHVVFTTWSRTARSIARSCRSGSAIMGRGSGSGDVGAVSVSEATGARPPRAIAGAIMPFATFGEPQTGQVTRPRSACSS